MDIWFSRSPLDVLRFGTVHAHMQIPREIKLLLYIVHRIRHGPSHTAMQFAAVFNNDVVPAGQFETAILMHYSSIS